MRLETLETGKSEVALVAGIIAVASQGRGGVTGQAVAFGRGDLHVGGGWAEVSHLRLPFVVSQRDVLVVLLDVLGELEE